MGEKGGIDMDEKRGAWISGILLFLGSLIPIALASWADYRPGHPTVWAFVLFFWVAAVAVVASPYLRGSSGSAGQTKEQS
jgi:hypothetical protein